MQVPVSDLPNGEMSIAEQSTPRPLDEHFTPQMFVFGNGACSAGSKNEWDEKCRRGKGSCCL